MSGNGYGLYSEHLNASLEAAGGPKGPQQAILLASLPATIAIVAATGGTPATTGPPLMIFAAVVAALCCTFEEVRMCIETPRQPRLTSSHHLLGAGTSSCLRFKCLGKAPAEPAPSHARNWD